MTIATKKEFSRGIIIRPDDVGVSSVEGEIKVSLTTKRLQVYIEGALRTVVTQSQVQTLTNKTIDADTNTITNLELDNLKVGVLNTSTTLASATDVQIPSALAVKTYIDDKAAAQNEASEIAYAPAGNITSTNVQVMGQELDGFINAEKTRATTAETLVQNNLNTHAASTTTHGVTGNIVGTTDTQTLTNKTINADTNTISEIEIDNFKSGVIITDITNGTHSQIPTGLAVLNSVQSVLSNSINLINDHVNNPTDAHDASAISVIPNGNLGSTDAQSAFVELQTDVDTKVTKATSSTDNSIPRFDGASGGVVQGSSVVISDTNAVSGITQLDVDNVRIDGNILSTTNTAPLSIEPNASTYIDLNGNVVLAANKYFAATPVNNNSTGANASVTINGKNILLTSAGLTSIDTMVADAYGKEVTLINRTGNDVTINNDTGASASERIYTGTGAPVVLKTNAAFSFVYDGTTQRWNLIGGTGSGDGAAISGGVTDVDTLLIQNFETATLQDFFYSSNFELNALSQINGLTSAKLTHEPLGGANQYFQQAAIQVPPKFRGQNITASVVAKSTAASGNVTVSFYDETNFSQIGTPQQIPANSSVDTYSIGFTIPATCQSFSYTITAIPENGSPVTYIDDIVFKLSKFSLLSTSVEVPVITEWQSYTPTFQGFGTPSNTEMQWRQNGGNVEIRGKFTSGVSTSVEARIGLPNGYVSASTLKIPSIQKAGSWTQSVAITGNGQTLIEPSASYLVFGYETGSSAGLAKINASGMISAGTVMSLEASVPVNGLSATQTKTIALTQSGIVQEADSAIRLDTYAGYGSTNNKIMRFTNIRQNLGSDIVYSSSSTLGDSFTVLTSGVYSLSFSCEQDSATVGGIGFSLNSTQLTTDILIINAQDRLAFCLQTSSSGRPSTSWSGYLNSGDVIRPHTSGGAVSATSQCHFAIVKQGSLKQVNVNTNSKITIPTSELRFEGSNSRGSTATAIVKFDTLAKLRGDAFEVVSTTADGTYVRMKKAGKLNVSATVAFSVAQDLYVTKNQAILTAVPTLPETLATATTSAGNYRDSASCETGVSVGDIIRVSSIGTPSSLYSSFNLSFQEQEIQVSVSNTLPQFSESDSSVRVDTANGYGSTATKIRRFSNVRDNIGTDVVYADSATNGSSFTVMESGIYNISYSDCFNSATDFGISKNASSLTANFNALSTSERLAFSSSGASALTETTSWQGYLNVRDVIRPHMSGTAISAVIERCTFTISKVGKPNVTGVDVTPFVNIPRPEKQASRIPSLSGTVSGTAANIRFNLSSLITDRTDIIRIHDDGVFTRFTALKRAYIRFSAMVVNGSANVLQIKLNGVNAVSGGNANAAMDYTQLSFNGLLEVGDYLTVNNSSTLRVASADFNFIAEAESDQIVTPLETFSTDTASLTYASSSQYTLTTLANAPVGTYITYTYAASSNTRTQTTTRPTQTDADMNVNGIQVFTRVYAATSSAGSPVAIAIQIGKGLKGVTKDLYKSAGKTTAGNIDWNIFDTNASAVGAKYKSYDEKTGILVFDAGWTAGATTSSVFDFNDITSQTSGYLVINASKNPALTGMNLVQPRIATIMDVKASGTLGGAFTAGTYQTRTLNTLEDTTGIVTGLVSNQFVLPAGQYYIEGTAPALNVAYHKAKLRNITDSTDAILGSAEYSRDTTPSGTVSFIRGTITLSTSKTFEVQHRCSITNGANGLGGAAAFGDNEIYTVVKITKIK